MTASSFKSYDWAVIGLLAALALVAGMTVFADTGDTRDNKSPIASEDMVRSQILSEAGDELYVQRYEVTVDQWNRCHQADACALKLRAKKAAAAATTPATGLNWFDVQQYVSWINSRSAHRFRLPTKAEWYALAKEVLPKKPDPIFTDPDLTWASAYLMTPRIKRKLRSTGSFKPNSDGIYDLGGNVWEWTSDCYSGSRSDVEQSDCPAFYVAGEHMAAIPIFTRKPARGGCAIGAPPAHLGLRLVSDTAISS